MSIEYFIRGSDNQIKLTLTEDDEPVFGAWDAVDIYFGGKTIHRDNDGDGVSLDTATGVLTIAPGDLTDGEQADIATLVPNRMYRARIVITTTLNNDGAVFGGAGSDPLYFHVSDKPISAGSPA